MSEKEGRRGWGVVVEYVIIFVVAFALAYILQNFIFGNFIIKQHSMEPTLQEFDRVFINRLVYKFTDPDRGDIIILVDPMDKNDDFVKRVVGLPGDTLEIKAGDVFINDKKLSEPYLAKDKSVDTMGPIRISDGEYFVMGDNRTVSLDSRRFGYIPKSGILGKVMLVWWPFSHVGIPD